MKFRALFFVLIILSSCQVNHQHDGVYIAEQPLQGVMRTWIIEGNVITYYLMGEVKVARCKQYEDRIETGDDVVYHIDEAGNLIVPGKQGRTADEKLIKRTSKTKFTPAELEKMIDDAMPMPGVLKQDNGNY
jgi:hypothetical protein